MSSPSLDRAVPLGHRPMSLLLQALRQIEGKKPDWPVAPASPRGPSEELSAYGGSYELIRVYDPSETATEIAVAGPAHVGEVPLVQATLESTPPKPPSRVSPRCRLAEEVERLLPEEDRSVIALTSLDGGEMWPVLHELCSELAAWKRAAVLAVRHVPGASPRETARGGAFAGNLAERRAHWQTALLPDPSGGFRVLDRGELEQSGSMSCRALLELWQTMQDQFAYIVVDATSRNAAVTTPILATSDATFLVLRLGGTHRRRVEQELERIRTVGGRPCGCLVLQ
ncbi:MAG TPA: hypothetical protein VNH11_10905 [Pirellulales bacterium]|nr:hypothetical protein [Pirellulales bacterium]